jgi:hypothetical protein
LAEKFPRAIIRRVTDLVPGGIVAKNDFADHALVFAEMSFFDQTIIGVVFVLQDKSKLFLWPKNFSTKKSSVLIQIPSNFFAQFAIFARGGGDSFVIGRIGFINCARAIGVKDDADANLAVAFLRESAARSDCDAEEKGKNEAAHDVLVGGGKVEGKAGEEKAKLRVERKMDRPLRRAMPKYVRLGREIDEIEQGNCVWPLTDPLINTLLQLGVNDGLGQSQPLQRFFVSEGGNR